MWIFQKNYMVTNYDLALPVKHAKVQQTICMAERYIKYTPSISYRSGIAVVYGKHLPCFWSNWLTSDDSRCQNRRQAILTQTAGTWRESVGPETWKTPGGPNPWPGKKKFSDTCEDFLSVFKRQFRMSVRNFGTTRCPNFSIIFVFFGCHRSSSPILVEFGPFLTEKDPFEWKVPYVQIFLHG